MSTPNDLVSKIIGARYEVKEFIDAGGMQNVYKAHDNTLNRDVALKTPKNPSAEKRFNRSAVVSAKINHPNVAKTLDYLEENGRAFLIEELILGKDLSKSLLNKVDYLDPFLVARIFHLLSKGLAASHHAGVVHRDMKPTNIMVSGEFNLNEIKITDFGIAKMADQELTEAATGGADSISASATAVGALPYMAPEAIETPNDITLKVDIWSLGAMMYELLTGNKPFGNGLIAVAKILSGKHLGYPVFVTNKPQFKFISEQLIKTIDQCLSVKPEDRPTADELVQKCGELCYPTSERFEGTINNFLHNRYGFISSAYNEVFYHIDSVYGEKPVVGSRVIYSKYDGGGRDRAYPVIKIK